MAARPASSLAFARAGPATSRSSSPCRWSSCCCRSAPRSTSAAGCTPATRRARRSTPPCWPAAAILQVNSEDTAGAIAAAQKYYNENVKTRLPVTDDTVGFHVADSGKAMTGSGTAYIKTPFLQLASISKLPLFSASDAEFSKSVGQRSATSEIALMLDVTGSMAGQKLVDLKAAAKKMVEILLGTTTTSVKIALVPFSEDVRLPHRRPPEQGARDRQPPNCRRLNERQQQQLRRPMCANSDRLLPVAMRRRALRDREVHRRCPGLRQVRRCPTMLTADTQRATATTRRASASSPRAPRSCR